MYKLRDIVNQIHSRRIKAELFPFKPNDGGPFVSRYQAALSKIIRELTEDELKEAEDLVETWNKQGPPPDFQLK